MICNGLSGLLAIHEARYLEIYPQVATKDLLFHNNFDKAENARTGVISGTRWIE
jgi:hypothetical protein